MYVLSSGAAQGFQRRGNTLNVVWCGLPTGSLAISKQSNLKYALFYGLKTVYGSAPHEEALDIYFSSGGRVTTKKMNAAGKIVCAKSRFDEKEPRSAFQFDARDTCP